jgi:hypothetical protein
MLTAQCAPQLGTTCCLELSFPSADQEIQAERDRKLKTARERVGADATGRLDADNLLFADDLGVALLSPLKISISSEISASTFAGRRPRGHNDVDQGANYSRTTPSFDFRLN